MIAVEMAVASRYDQDSYGILFISRYVYRITGRGVHNRSHPHRIKVWDNTGRPNADPGRWGVGPGRYIGPDGRGTDDELSIITSAESVAITNSGTNTGTAASGQVYADTSLTIGDKVMLVLPGGRMPVSALLTVTARPLSDPILVPVS